SALHDEVAALYVAQIAHSLKEGLYQVGCAPGVVPNPANSSELGRLLRLAAERPSEDAPTHHRDERSPVHYWMISSARVSTDCGIVSPRALAVLRLMTKSNLVDCSTGSSDGLAPRRIWSIRYAARRYMSARSGPYDMRPPFSVNSRAP